MKALKAETAQRKKPTKKYTGSNGRYVNYKPTAEEKTAIKDSGQAVDDALDTIIAVAGSDATIRISYQPEQDAYCLLVSTREENWQERRTVSFWHVDWTRCLQMASYALVTRFKGFPKSDVGQENQDSEW